MLTLRRMNTAEPSANHVESSSESQLQHLQQLLREALSLARQLAASGGATWTPHLKRLCTFIDFVDQRNNVSANGFAAPTGEAPALRFAALLKSKREAAHLSLMQLAKLAGISVGTMKNMEKGSVSASRDTLRRLIEVPQLCLNYGEVLKILKSTEHNYNCLIPPGYDTMEMVKDLAKILNGPGGHIEQTNAYLEHRSAMALLAECQDPAFVARFREPFPSKMLASRIISESGQMPFKVIALGPGDGHLEVRFLQCLHGKLENPDIKFVLFDISHPLLTTAYQHTLDVLGSAVDTVMIQGNFHDLAQHPQVTELDAKTPRRQVRVYLMLGHTLANLDNEPRFFQHNLSHCRPGDFLVLDFQQRSSPATATEAEIRRSDPALSNPYPAKKEDWLSTPLRMHCPDLISYKFSLELETQSPIPGSYMLDVFATVRSKSQPERRFSVFRHKRYDEELLRRALSRFGWECVTTISFGPDKSNIAMLLIKRDTNTKH